MRPIDADAFLERLDLRNTIVFGIHEMIKIQAKDILDEEPTIDAVPVVRCEDCENWERDWLCSSGNLKEHFCPMIGIVTDHKFYCKHGARMDGEEHDSC